MKFINLTDQSIKTQGQIRKENPNVSLPRIWNDNVYELLNIQPVFDTPKPAPSTDVKIVYEDGAELIVSPVGLQFVLMGLIQFIRMWFGMSSHDLKASLQSTVTTEKL